MTWPAPDLPINYQNATVSADTHPAAHNDTNLTLNDDYRPEINRLGGVVAGLGEQIRFEPIWTNLVPGTGLNRAYYSMFGPDQMHIVGTTSIGTGGSVGAGPRFRVPNGRELLAILGTTYFPYGRATCADAGSSAWYRGNCFRASNTQIGLYTSADNQRIYGVSASNPFTWAPGDSISYSLDITLEPV